MTDIDKLTAQVPTSLAEPLQMSYDASLISDIADFQGRLDASSSNLEEDAGPTVARAVAEPLSAMNAEARELAEFAANALSSGDEMTPSEIVSLTVKSQEFMFHSQLTANIANRTADGIQQLFKQQG